MSKRVDKGRTAIYTEIAAGNFPRPVKTGKRSVAWVESEIDQYIEGLIAKRDAQFASNRAEAAK
ncbi:MAG: AlpA family phage regulatory protein [Betaproteobacteria bacterium]|nr:MAG: AlpA family phage regulatory protein [Betaproteobacteria bacterium]